LVSYSRHTSRDATSLFSFCTFRFATPVSTGR
jgi:hypothetical protein